MLQADTAIAVHEHSPSRPSSSAPSDADAEAAAQQLVSETQSRSPVANIPLPSAILGANLLNAARIDQRHSSPAGDMARKTGGTGKLKRVSMVAEGPRQNLARRGDVYDIELSPEKGRYALPEKVNHKKLKVVRKKSKKVEQQGDHGPVPSSGLPVLVAGRRESVEDVAQAGAGDDNGNELQSGDEEQLRSSPPEAALPGSDNNASGIGEETGRPEDVEIEGMLANGKTRCAAVSYKYDKRLGSRYQQCKRPGSSVTDAGMLCNTHMDKPAAVRCGETTKTKGATTQCHRTATVETVNGARCPIHEYQHATQRPKLRIERDTPPSAQPPSKRKWVSDNSSDVPRRPRKDLEQGLVSSDSTEKNRPQVQLPVRKSTKQRSTKEQMNTNDNADSGGVEQSELEPTGKRGKPRKQASNRATVLSQQVPDRERRADRNREESVQTAMTADGVASDDAPDEEDYVRSDSEGRNRGPKPAAELTGDIETVFQFLDVEERSGTCQTKLATIIKNTCGTVSPKQDESMSMDEVMERVARLQAKLERVHSHLDKTDQPAFKADAYGHIFCHLTLFLKALHDWLFESCGTVTESLEAMRILSPFMGDILALKDTIATWNVSVPQRYKGDRIIRDVDSGLIAPLRRVEKVYYTRLSQLENAQRRCEQQEALQRRAQQQAEEERINMEAEEKRRKKWACWQALHITRMQCEPNPHRRQKLVITRIESSEASGERDANGFEFERVPVFTPRSHPPQHAGLTGTDNREWTDEEETALLDGLEHCAGKPDSFLANVT